MEKKSATVNVIAGLLLIGACVTAGILYSRQVSKNAELEQQLQELTKREQQSVVMQHVNAQMEEIANEERRISDEQRDVAIEQTRVAEQERQNAEQQQRQAEAERQNALIAEQKAVEASQTAQNQRRIAEHQRSEAEYSKRVADTLSYITLARSLGNTAQTQYRAGNREVADLLAYTAIIFTTRYHGDIYYPSVYQALAMTSQNRNLWAKHKGSITDIAFYEDIKDGFISCSTYGEVLKHRLDGPNLQTSTIIRNSKYDFRDVYIDRNKKTIYALSRTSELLVFKNEQLVEVLPVSIAKLKGMEVVGRQFVLFGESGMALFDPESRKILKTKDLSFRVVSISRYDNTPLLFDDRGRQHLIKSFDRIETQPVPVKGQVTAFAESKNQHIKAYGMKDGTLYYINPQGKVTRLSGHRSQISKIKINGQRIYSASYDGTLNLWMTNLAKLEAMTLFSVPGWIINFTYDPRKTYIWTGDQKGDLTQALISVPTMIKRLQRQLKRNLTREEWQYYIGDNVPYEEIIGKEVRL